MRFFWSIIIPLGGGGQKQAPNTPQPPSDDLAGCGCGIWLVLFCILAITVYDPDASGIVRDTSHDGRDSALFGAWFVTLCLYQLWAHGVFAGKKTGVYTTHGHENDMRIALAKELQSKGIDVDWTQHSEVELVDWLGRARIGKDLEKYGITVEWRDHSLDDLYRMLSAHKAVQTIPPAPQLTAARPKAPVWKCPKCGSPDTLVKYEAEPFEHLERKCVTCGYGCSERVADHKPTH